MSEDVGRRAYLTLTRGTLVKPDDSKKLQELTIRDRFGEKRTNVEHWHPYGQTHVPIEPKDGKEAEVLIAYLGGSPDHPIVIGVADRRHRPKGLKPGESALHDDQGQSAAIKRDGYVVEAKKITLKVGEITFVLSSEGIDITGGHIKHNGKRIDAQHKHGGVQSGGSITDVPVG